MEQAKREVLRYLGYRQQVLEPGLDRIIDDCMAEMRQTARPLHVWRLFAIHAGHNRIRLEGTPLVLEGADIYRHLAKAEYTALMAVTLGGAADALIRRWERSDLTRSVILDACATQYVEEICDTVEDEVKARAGEMGLGTNFRYSPGYGDLSLEVQPKILEVLDASRRIGLTCTDNLILLPRKSVTALIGLVPGDVQTPGKRSCAACSLREACQFRRDGVPGGCESLAEK